MNFVREQEIKIDEKDVFIIDVINYENAQYLYTQDIVDDELVEKYTIYKYVADKNAMLEIKDSDKVNVLASLFRASIEKIIQEEM